MSFDCKDFPNGYTLTFHTKDHSYTLLLVGLDYNLKELDLCFNAQYK